MNYLYKITLQTNQFIANRILILVIFDHWLTHAYAQELMNDRYFSFLYSRLFDFNCC